MGTRALHNNDWSTASQYFANIVDVLGEAIAKSTATIPVPNLESIPPLSARLAHPILYIPIEIKARELEAKCLLALAALHDGFTVVIGRKWVLSAGYYRDLPPGIVLFKTLNGLDANEMAAAATHGGHLIAAIDEEAFGRNANRRATELNIDPSALRIADNIYVQSQKHLDSYASQVPEQRDAMIVSGNVKADLFKIKRTTGTPKRNVTGSRNILFCTMSGNINPMGRSFYRTVEQTLALGANGAFRNMVADLSQLMKESALFEIDMLGQFSAAVKVVASAFPAADIVVRPHPIEDPALWQDRFSGLLNVRVETGGSLPDWLRWANAMVYISGCASGVEAALQGTPAIRFEGDGTTQDPDVGLSNSLNHAARSGQDVANALANMMNVNAELHDDNESGLSDYFYDPETTWVCERVSSLARGLQQAYPHPDELPLELLVNLKARRKSAITLKPFHLRKFPDTPASEITDLMTQLAHAFELEIPFDVREIEDGLFLIRAD